LRVVMERDGGNAEAVLAELARQGVNEGALAADLQRKGTEAFARSWGAMMGRIASKSEKEHA